MAKVTVDDLVELALERQLDIKIYYYYIGHDEPHFTIAVWPPPGWRGEAIASNGSSGEAAAWESIKEDALVDLTQVSRQMLRRELGEVDDLEKVLALVASYGLGFDFQNEPDGSYRVSVNVYRENRHQKDTLFEAPNLRDLAEKIQKVIPKIERGLRTELNNQIVSNGLQLLRTARAVKTCLEKRGVEVDMEVEALLPGDAEAPLQDASERLIYIDPQYRGVLVGQLQAAAKLLTGSEVGQTLLELEAPIYTAVPMILP